jgi:hypothetical protein
MKKLLLLITITISFIFVNCSGVPEETSYSGKKYPVEKVMEIIAEENDVTRTLYTKAIVGKGKKQGMKFDEDWEKNDVEAGPLPALFLRGVSYSIQQGDVPLGLHLGSDFPINDANLFTGDQATLFKKIKTNIEAEHFYDEGTKLYTSMFADLASAPACVTCHNEHPQTPKKDWKLGDVMGATTWQYPKDSLTTEEVIDVIKAYRQGTIDIYSAYLTEISNFKETEKPTIGRKWPEKGYYLPTAEVFVDSVRKLVSHESMEIFF